MAVNWKDYNLVALCFWDRYLKLNLGKGVKIIIFHFLHDFYMPCCQESLIHFIADRERSDNFEKTGTCFKGQYLVKSAWWEGSKGLFYVLYRLEEHIHTHILFMMILLYASEFWPTFGRSSQMRGARTFFQTFIFQNWRSFIWTFYKL